MGCPRRICTALARGSATKKIVISSLVASPLISGEGVIILVSGKGLEPLFPAYTGLIIDPSHVLIRWRTSKFILPGLGASYGI